MTQFAMLFNVKSLYIFNSANFHTKQNPRAPLPKERTEALRQSDTLPHFATIRDSAKIYGNLGTLQPDKGSVVPCLSTSGNAFSRKISQSRAFPEPVMGSYPFPGKQQLLRRRFCRLWSLTGRREYAQKNVLPWFGSSSQVRFNLLITRRSCGSNPISATIKTPHYPRIMRGFYGFYTIRI